MFYMFCIVRNKDQTWPEEMTNVMNAKWDQKSQGL